MLDDFMSQPTSEEADLWNTPTVPNPLTLSFLTRNLPCCSLKPSRSSWQRVTCSTKRGGLAQSAEVKAGGSDLVAGTTVSCHTGRSGSQSR